MIPVEDNITRRSPDQVMRLKRLGSFHQSRLSFMRQLTRRMANENWVFSRPVFNIGPDGVGHAVYTAQGPDRTYSLVAFSHDLPDEDRSDRVIAEAWDATFALFDGVPTQTDIKRLSGNVPVQEAGRVTERELTLSRANRSVRLWEHTIDRLASGHQPDPDLIRQTGYLMRTTAVYGSGKFGAADRETLADRAELQAPFQAEMLTVYLIRTFTRDLTNHMAKNRSADAVSLAPEIAQQLGIGNSTGLGMAPFIVNHPVLFNNWIIVREEAIARVRSVKHAIEKERSLFLSLIKRSRTSIGNWHSSHPIQQEKLAQLNRDVKAAFRYLEDFDLSAERPWDHLVTWAENNLGEEGQEWLASLILEPYGALVDGLTSCMADSNSDAFRIDGAMSVGQVRTLLKQQFGWAEEIDWNAPENIARAWYVSEEKLEPRLGERFEEPVAEYEQPLAPARDAIAALKALTGYENDAPIAQFLMQHHTHRHTIRRAQMARFAPYGEIRDNTISNDVLPIDMLRAKLSFFGATHFDPRSDRWVRICMYAGAPYPEDLNTGNADFWVYPEASA